MVIMNDDLRRIPEIIRLSRRTHTVLWRNITLALSICRRGRHVDGRVCRYGGKPARGCQWTTFASQPNNFCCQNLKLL